MTTLREIISKIRQKPTSGFYMILYNSKKLGGEELVVPDDINPEEDNLYNKLPNPQTNSESTTSVSKIVPESNTIYKYDIFYNIILRSILRDGYIYSCVYNNDIIQMFGPSRTNRTNNLSPNLEPSIYFNSHTTPIKGLSKEVARILPKYNYFKWDQLNQYFKNGYYIRPISAFGSNDDDRYNFNSFLKSSNFTLIIDQKSYMIDNINIKLKEILNYNIDSQLQSTTTFKYNTSDILQNNCILKINQLFSICEKKEPTYNITNTIYNTLEYCVTFIVNILSQDNIHKILKISTAARAHYTELNFQNHQSVIKKWEFKSEHFNTSTLPHSNTCTTNNIQQIQRNIAENFSFYIPTFYIKDLDSIAVIHRDNNDLCRLIYKTPDYEFSRYKIGESFNTKSEKDYINATNIDDTNKNLPQLIINRNKRNTNKDLPQLIKNRNKRNENSGGTNKSAINTSSRVDDDTINNIITQILDILWYVLISPQLNDYWIYIVIQHIILEHLYNHRSYIEFTTISEIPSLTSDNDQYIQNEFKKYIDIIYKNNKENKNFGSLNTTKIISPDIHNNLYTYRSNENLKNIIKSLNTILLSDNKIIINIDYVFTKAYLILFNKQLSYLGFILNESDHDDFSKQYLKN